MAKRGSLVALVFLLSSSVAAASESLDAILKRSEPPAGVVFEVVSGDADALRKALPVLRDAVDRLRSRFPGIALAVVSHGREELALTSRNRERFTNVHSGVQDLVSDQVPVHVCGTYAGWHGVQPEEFPSYVDVVSQGPSQIRDYKEFGYLHVVLEY